MDCVNELVIITIKSPFNIINYGKNVHLLREKKKMLFHNGKKKGDKIKEVMKKEEKKMYVVIPRNDEWLPSMFKEFDVMEVKDEKVKIFFECDVIETLGFSSNDRTFDLKKGIQISGLMNQEELEKIRKIPYVYIASIKHVYALDQESDFFGESGGGGHEIDDDDYYVVCHLSKEAGEIFLREEIVRYLPKEIRLKELFK